MIVKPIVLLHYFELPSGNLVYGPNILLMIKLRRVL